MDDTNAIFYLLLARYTYAIEKNYQARYKRAKDKEFIKAELQRDTDFALGWPLLNQDNEKLVDVFTTWYKRGEDISDIFKHIRKTYGEIDDELPYKRIENGKKITLYLSEEEKALKALALNERKLMKVLVRQTAFSSIKEKLPTMFENDTPKTQPISALDLRWTGTKENKNEFVQLVYGLHKAGFINEGKGEITKIVEALAGVFKVHLGKGWQANHSSSIHKSKNTYQPPVFKKIQEAYKKYCEQQIEAGNKRK